MREIVIGPGQGPAKAALIMPRRNHDINRKLHRRYLDLVGSLWAVQDSDWHEQVIAAPLHQCFTLDSQHADGLSDAAARVVRQYGLSYTVCRVPQSEAPFAGPDPQAGERLVWFRFQASHDPTIVRYSLYCIPHSGQARGEGTSPAGKQPLKHGKLRALERSTEPGSMVRVLEKPLHPGWVYPCTVEEIEQQLLTFPPEDLKGLAVICLIPALRRDLEDRGVDGRYCGGRATIYLYGWPDPPTYKYPKGTKRHHLGHLDVERSFGMHVEQIGRRWFCRWDREDWRRYVLEHVLPHEIGHHVCGLSEQLAEEYALQYLHRLKGTGDALTSRRKEPSPRG